MLMRDPHGSVRAVKQAPPPPKKGIRNKRNDELNNWVAGNKMVARIWGDGSRRDRKGVEGRRSRVHTLVAHHQVCQTLKENKSTVSREQGIVGSCVTPTRRHLVQRRCLCYSRERREREERGERRTQTGIHTMSIQSTGAGCDASSVTYSDI